MNEVSKEELYKLYIEEKKTMRQTAEELGVAAGTVHKLLHAYGMETRKRGTKGRVLAEEHKKTISRRHKGKHVPVEVRKKMSESHKIGGIGRRKKRTDGYIGIYFPDHPKSNAEGFIMEHVLVMECLIGRWLEDNEVVHHINGKRDDNKKENLQLMTKTEHTSYHMKKRHEERRRNKHE